MKFLLSCALALLAARETAAKPTFVPLIPGSTNVPGVDSVGHLNPAGGGAPNPFGLAFKGAGLQWTMELCYADSDGDKQFNGAELGDPCCEWVKDKNEKLAYTTASAPGDAKSTNDPTLWEAVTCANGQGPVAKYLAYVNSGAAGNSTSSADKDSAEQAAPKATVPAPTPSKAPVNDATSVSASTAVATASVAAVAWLLR
ncbi:hypothetical protein PINS_up010816 [Pythium insidiosum]|nr:hypothetical protein PINS_up010816 [Pythium insidiosum]